MSDIPTVRDLAADPVSHHYDDMIAPAGLTNFLGTVRIEHDLTAIGAVTFPPVSQGAAKTAALFVDGRLFESTGAEVTHAWRPDRVVRAARLDGLEIESTTVCVPGRSAVAVDVRVSNRTGERREVRLGFALAATVTAAEGAWLAAEPPAARNDAEAVGARMVFRDAEGSAWSVQGLDAPGARVVPSGVAGAPEEFAAGIGGIGRGGEADVVLDIPADESERVGYVQAVGAEREGAEAAYAAVVADVPGAIAAAEEFWDAQLEAAFTPGNTEFSGHLPVLRTADPALRRLYWWGVLGVIWFRRDYPTGVLGRSYDTLMPNYWSTTTFIWDYSLSGIVHALLDPEPMRAHLRHWIRSDIHTHFGTSALTGGPVGGWYSVNDYAMTRLVDDYVRYTGDLAFLGEEIDGVPVTGHLVRWATAWRGLRGTGGLADYGEIDNLLECVSSYTHEVASLNAANAWNLRTTAGLLRLRGDDGQADALEEEADGIVLAVGERYLPGTGYFAAGQPDGTLMPVRHCYDFSIVGTTIAGDLDAATWAEMVDFFARELQTDTWMRALSPWDPDAAYSVRPDHQWNGAYPAWPADAARALVELGAPERALAWIDGLARTANQGPPGQAHFTEEAMPAVAGGARKAPPQLPYIIDWACSSAGAYAGLVIESLFGVRVTASGVSARAVIGERDAGAELRGLRAGTRTVTVTATGGVTDGRVLTVVATP